MSSIRTFDYYLSAEAALKVARNQYLTLIKVLDLCSNPTELDLDKAIEAESDLNWLKKKAKDLESRFSSQKYCTRNEKLQSLILKYQ